jgi:hypothetical protein
MTGRTRRARSGSGVRRARLEGGKRSGPGREPRKKAVRHAKSAADHVKLKREDRRNQSASTDSSLGGVPRSASADDAQFVLSGCEWEANA